MRRNRRVGKGSPRFPPGAIRKMREMRNEGSSIDEIAEAFGTGKSTVWPHVKDINFDKSKSILEVPVEPERSAQKVATKHSTPAVTPPPPPRVVTVNSEVPVEPELMGILAGLALKAGYSSLSEYLRKEGLPWLQTKNETIVEQINSSHELVKVYKDAIALRTELVKTTRLLHSREAREANRRQERGDFVKLMALLGQKPDEIEKVVSQLERFDPSPTMGDSPAATWVQRAPRPRAPPPILIEETPRPGFHEASRVRSQVGTIAQPEPPQPMSPRDSSQQIEVDRIRTILKRADKMKKKDKQGGADRD